MVAKTQMRLKLVREGDIGEFLVYIILKVYKSDHSIALKLLS